MNNAKLLPGLVIFSEVVRQQSFTKAAAQLGMSKSAVSQQVRRLEQHVGTELLLRNTRRMTLTAVGEQLAEKALALQDQAEFALTEALHAQENPTGEFAITYPALLERSVVGPALLQLSREFKGLTFRAVSTEQPLDLLRENLDVAIYAGRLPDSIYRALPLGTMNDVFYVSHDLLRGRDVPSHPENLTEFNWILPNWQKAPIPYFANEQAANDPEPQGRIVVEPHLRCTSMDSLLRLTARGLGAALIPEIGGLEHDEKRQLVRVAPGFRGRAWPFYFVHPYQDEKPIHVRRFYELLKRNFAKALVPWDRDLP